MIRGVSGGIRNVPKKRTVLNDRFIDLSVANVLSCKVVTSTLCTRRIWQISVASTILSYRLGVKQLFDAFAEQSVVEPSAEFEL